MGMTSSWLNIKELLLKPPNKEWNKSCTTIQPKDLSDLWCSVCCYWRVGMIDKETYKMVKTEIAEEGSWSGHEHYNISRRINQRG